MKKRGMKLLFVFLTILLILFSTSLVIAQDEETEDTTAEQEANLEKAYDCVRDKVGNNCGALSSEEQTFSILALGDYENCEEKLLENARSQECWPKASCKLKDTALALFAFDRINEDTSKIESWLLNQTKTASDLIWLLQIEADTATSCTISYGTSTNTIEIFENKKISSSAGTCLPLSENGYWLKIKSDSACLNNEYKISCDQNFLTTLLYKTAGSPTIHVSQIVHSNSAGGETIEKIVYKCFKQGTACNYEASLWAALALNYKGHEITNFLPYLQAAADENSQLFPESFLYILTGENEYLTTVLVDNFKTEFWNVGGNKYYDTALGFLSLQTQETTQEDAAREYLLNGKTQNTKGCWNNVPDTGFLLWAGWDLLDSEIDDDDDDDFPPEYEEDCEPTYGYCEYMIDCINIGGIELDSYNCDGIPICCDTEVVLQTCSQQGGEICDIDYKCPLGAETYTSSDYGTCCSEACVEVTDPDLPTYTCGDESNEGVCKSECIEADKEFDNYETCPANQTCCEKEKASLWWIWVLLGLILIVIILILFRNKLRLLLFKSKSKFKKQPAPKSPPPGFTPGAGLGGPAIMPRARPRPVFHAPARRPAARRPGRPRKSVKEKDFDATLKKLREMSK